VSFAEKFRVLRTALFHGARDSFRDYKVGATSREIQILLKAHYRATPGLCFGDVGFRKISQFEEDGILLYIFSRIGETTRQVVEICAGNGRECMAANLILNHGWQGLLFDGSAANVAEGRDFYRRHADAMGNPPVFVQAWLSAENINDEIRKHGVSGEVDLFSLDVDGNDYWFWKALDVISPRVCVIETNSAIPSHLALTSPYAPDFQMKDAFHSASLAAIAKLGREKGYRLIGTNNAGFNAFLMRNDVGQADFPEITVEQAHDKPGVRRGQAAKWPKRKDLPWVEV